MATAYRPSADPDHQYPVRCVTIVFRMFHSIPTPPPPESPPPWFYFYNTETEKYYLHTFASFVKTPRQKNIM